jgi:predicted TIM-barrel fold metal-dependent hydrolase
MNDIEVVDTHQHLWDLSKQKYSWCAGVAQLNQSFVMSDYLAATKGANLVASVHVEADVDEEDLAKETQWLLSLVKDRSNPMQALVIKALPEREDFAKYLDQFAGEQAIKGVRRVLHTQADDLSTTQLFRENLRLLGDRGLSFDLCALPRQLPNIIELVKACPKVSFILDHCGVPDVKGKELDPWREHVRRLSELPNVVACKISGLVAYADPAKWSVEDLKPFVDHVVECFGHDRIIFGSDWPVCTLTCPLGDWLSAAKTLAANWSTLEQKKFLSQNAKRVYRL